MSYYLNLLTKRLQTRFAFQPFQRPRRVLPQVFVVLCVLNGFADLTVEDVS